MSNILQFLVRAAGLAWVIVVLVGQAAPTVLAQAPPVNDICSGALVIPAAGPFPYFTPITLDISGASTNGDPEFPSCGSTLSRSVWYTFTPDASASYAFSVCDDTSTTVLDTVMAIYRSTGGCAGPFTEVACNDDACGLRSGTLVSLTRDRTYYILVWLFGSEVPSPGESAVQLRVTKPVAPPNDACSGAVTIPPGGPFPHLTMATDLTLATRNGDPPTPSCQANISRSIWYRFTPATNAVYRISTCAGETGSTVVDSVMAVYRSSGCGGPFVEVDCNDDACGTQAALSSSLRAGTNYWILVWAYDVGGPPIGGTDIRVRTGLVSPPIVTSIGASNITATTATLFALINPGEGSAVAGFHWGTSTNYGNSSALEEAGSGAANFGVSLVVESLSPATTYHFRAVATNEAGVVLGADSVFTTAAPPSLIFPRILAGGSFEFQFIGFSGTPYTVQVSANLLDWELLGPALNMGGGLFFYRDDPPSDHSSRYYRITSP